MIGYKLTDQLSQTHGKCQWGPGVTHETDGKGGLCGSGWLHYYESPLLAVLHNPIHGCFADPLLWQCDIEGEIKRDGAMKSGCTRLTTIGTIPLPTVTREQRVRYAICCAWGGATDAWRTWATAWLSDEDRSAASAASAAQSAWPSQSARSAASAAQSAQSAESAAAWSAQSAQSAESAALATCSEWAIGDEIVPRGAGVGA